MSSITLPEYGRDIFSDDGIVHPYEYYREIRKLGPVVRYPMYDCYVLGRYDDVRRVLRDAETFISGKGVFLSHEMNAQVDSGIFGILMSDGPRHDLLRNVEGVPLGSEAVAKVAENIQGEANRLIERIMAGARQIDAMQAIAEYLPVTIVSELVGLPEEGRENMLAWAGAGFQLMGPFNARAQSSMDAMNGLFDYVLHKVDQAKVKPGSWSWKVFKAVEEGTITLDMVPGMLIDFIGPSLDTTILGTGSLLMLLAQHRDQWQALKAEPALIPNAVNEALRMESPVRGLTRYVAREAEIGGVKLEAGSRVLVLYGSANRDEHRWEEPERFDIRRPRAASHLAFGFGEHRCLGANLARLEMQSILKAMVARVDSIEVGEPVFLLNNILRGPASLPMSLN